MGAEFWKCIRTPSRPPLVKRETNASKSLVAQCLSLSMLRMKLHVYPALFNILTFFRWKECLKLLKNWDESRIEKVSFQPGFWNEIPATEKKLVSRLNRDYKRKEGSLKLKFFIENADGSEPDDVQDTKTDAAASEVVLDETPYADDSEDDQPVNERDQDDDVGMADLGTIILGTPAAKGTKRKRNPPAKAAGSSTDVPDALPRSARSARYSGNYKF